MTDNLDELKQIFPGVPVLDEEQKVALRGAFEAVVSQARAEENLPKSRWETFQEEKAARQKGKKKKRKDPRMPDDYITSTHKWFERYGDESVKGLSTAQFARAHEALRKEEGIAQILYGSDEKSVHDSDLFFALKQIYVQLKRPELRR